jgi:hypothetical protein
MWLASLPLLAASLSRNPQVVSLLEFTAGLPWEVVPAIVDFQAAVPHLSPAMG